MSVYECLTIARERRSIKVSSSMSSNSAALTAAGVTLDALGGGGGSAVDLMDVERVRGASATVPTTFLGGCSTRITPFDPEPTVAFALAIELSFRLADAKSARNESLPTFAAAAPALAFAFAITRSNAAHIASHSS